MRLIKTHAYGNDFLLVERSAVHARKDLADVARRACDRHRGVGADGLLIVDMRPHGAAMALFNADGSPSEVSGNGVRCIGAWLARERTLAMGAELVIDTVAGPKGLTLIAQSEGRVTFRAAMGAPAQVQREALALGDGPIDVVTLSVGNPHCVILGPATLERLHRLGPALATHPRFVDGTNVELAEVVAPDRVQMLVWERGVGPTESSGTGTCAAAVAAAECGGAARTVDVIAPGGTQRVEWTDAGLFLTGWATVVADVDWVDVR